MISKCCDFQSIMISNVLFQKSYNFESIDYLKGEYMFEMEMMLFWNEHSFEIKWFWFRSITIKGMIFWYIKMIWNKVWKDIIFWCIKMIWKEVWKDTIF